MFDAIEWVSVEERKPCGYIVLECGFKEIAEYLVHVSVADYPTFARFLDGEFVACGDGVLFAGDIDCWAEIPKWNH